MKPSVRQDRICRVIDGAWYSPNCQRSCEKLLLRIINDILDFSKIKAGKLEMESIPFHLESVLQNVSQPFLPQMREKGLELVYDIAPDVPKSLVGDPTRLGQVILNLVSNAIKFTHDGRIVIRVVVVSLQPFDVVLMDIQMPEMDGLEATQRIRADRQFDVLPTYCNDRSCHDRRRRKESACRYAGAYHQTD